MSAIPHLTIAYITFRREPRIQWFLDSIKSPPQNDSMGASPHRIVVIDYYAEERNFEFKEALRLMGIIHTPPKPCVWQGKHRITKEDFFAASNARNTALCLAPDGWIAYVDDLSVLSPTWMTAVRRAQREGYIVYGAFKKVLGLMVEEGVVKGYREHPHGVDSRWGYGRDNGPVSAAGSWLFGCSLAAPVECFLQINGWDEDCDSLGSEDSIAGIMLAHHWKQFRYDRSMFTFESEEDHHTQPSLKRYDKGVSPNDKSHAIVKMAMRDRKTAPNYFGPGGIREVRRKVLNGEPFQICQIPQHDWFDGQPLGEVGG